MEHDQNTDSLVYVMLKLNKHTQSYITLLTISIATQFFIVMQQIHPISLRRPQQIEPEQTVSVSHIDTETLYTPSSNKVVEGSTLSERTVSSQVVVEIPSSNEVSNITKYSVSNNDYAPGTYKFIVDSKSIGTIIVYSNGSTTTIKTDGRHLDYPAMSLSSDSYYMSDIKVKLKKE